MKRAMMHRLEDACMCKPGNGSVRLMLIICGVIRQKAKTVLGWNPQKTTYAQLVEIMAKHDRQLAKQEKA